MASPRLIDARARRIAMPANQPWGALLANGLLFNISWLVIVLSESSLIAGIQVAVHLLVHFTFLGRGLPEARLVAQVALMGLILDQLLFRAGVFTLAGQSAYAPLWLSCLWPVFATTLCHAFSGFAARPLVAAALGGVSGALSYVAGVRLTAVEFGSGTASVLLIAVLWALLFPLLLRLASRRVPLDARV